METISFKIIYDFIKNELMKKSIDSVFNNSHEYFENNIFCKDKMIHKILVSGLIKIDEIDEKSILECDESFIERSFEVWAEENLKKIQTFKDDKQMDIDRLNLELIKNESGKTIVSISLEKETSKTNSIQIKIDGILNEISQAGKRKESNEIKIANNLKEIEKIKLTPEFKGIKTYENRIKELEKENFDIPKIFDKQNEKLNSDLVKYNDEKQNCETVISELSEQIKNINIEYSLIKGKVNLLLNDKTEFDIEVETKLFKEICNLLLYPIDNKINKETFFCNFLNKSNLFKESFPINQDIDFDKVKKSLLGVLSTPIPSKTKNSYIKFFRRLYYDTDFLTLNQYESPDDVAAIFLAILSSFSDKNIIRTDSGIIYINFGNGIFAKLLIRKNIDHIVEDILLIGKSTLKESNYTNKPWDYYNSIYNNKYIFSGYTDSGFITNVGLYLITKELVFEIYFEASSLLIDNKHIPLFQTISDSKKKADIDYQRDMEMDDDD